MNFLKTFAASFIAVITAIVIGIPIIFIVIGGIFASIGSSQDQVEVKSGTILKMSLSGVITETETGNPIELDLGDLLGVPGAGNTRNIGLFQLLRKIEQAKNDKKVKGIYLNLTGTVGTGWANLRSIRDALLEFKSDGKFIYAYSELYTEKAYYLASVADKVYLPPEGMLEFNGLASSRMFYKGMFDKVNLEPKVFKVGTFKSAVEPYLRKDMSEASKLQTEEYLKDIWNIFIEDVSASRSLSPEKLNELADNFIMGEGPQAKKEGLIDEVLYESDVLDRLKEAVGKESDESLELLAFKKFMKVPGKYKSSKNKIAVIFAEGAINSGKSSQGSIGSETVISQLRKARKDKKIKAIVLRINSPGGSALASDMMANEIRLCKAEKPVIASFGDVAASGGYYMGAPCDYIFARRNTITGSIGIFGMWMELSQALENHIGITFDAVETHEHANLGDPSFPLTKAEEAFIQAKIERGYGSFIEVVRSGRNFRDSAAVDAIAQGRVWSGQAAKERNLIDAYGELDDAIAYAAQQVGIEEDYKIHQFKPSDNPFEEIFKDFMVDIRSNDPLYQELETLRKIKQTFPTNGTYALMPYDLKIE
ncbi:MAG: signal peptide peptidase SppA [Bacteroidota bacterium]